MSQLSPSAKASVPKATILYSTITQERYLLTDLCMGMGVNAEVILATGSGPSVVELAVKCYLNEDPNESKKEIEVMQHLNSGLGAAHPNIMPLLDVVTRDLSLMPGPRCIVMPCGTSSLEEWFLENGLDLPQVVRIEITRQLLSGLAYLQLKGVVHRDLHFHNFMMHSMEGVVKFADFGSAEILPIPDDDPERSAEYRLREELARLVTGLVAEMWLGRKYGEQEANASDAFKGQEDVAEEHANLAVELAYHHAKESQRFSRCFFMTCEKVQDWNRVFRSHPNIEPLVYCVHEWEWTQVTSPDPMFEAPPSHVITALRGAMQLGPEDATTAVAVSAAMDAVVPNSQRSAATKFIRTGQVLEDLKLTL
eukprot:scpid84085/ scgid13100/ Cell division control protein 7